MLTARLRDARFFWDEDRRAPLESRIDRLGTILFHKKLGSYREKAERVAALSASIARDAFARPDAAAAAERAGRLCKVDLATDMVRELTELQGTMGGIYTREEGQPEEIWKAISLHYLPIGVEVDAPPSAKQLGKAAVTWAAVSLADKLDSVVQMFAAGERPTGSRDPLGLRRQAQGVVKILADLPELTGMTARIRLWDLVTQASSSELAGDPRQALSAFFRDRVLYLFEQRGFDIRTIRAVVPEQVYDLDVLEARRKLEALVQMSGSEALLGVATLFKRVKNISKGIAAPASLDALAPALTEPAEQALRSELQTRAAAIREAAGRSDYRAAFTGIAALEPAVAKFFDDVLVMVDDERVRAARLGLVASLRDLISSIADLSEMVTE